MSHNHSLECFGLPIAGKNLHLHHETFPFIIETTPKAACTPVLLWFLHHVGKFDEAFEYGPWPHDYEQQVFMRREGYWRDLTDAMDRGKPVYKFVRNPFSRAVSSFLILGENLEPGHFGLETLRHVHDTTFEDTGYPVDNSFAVSFRQFLQWLQATGVSQSDVNPHFGQQYREGENITGFVKVENLHDELRAMEKRFGLEPAPEKVLSRSPHSRHYGKAAFLATDTPIAPGMSSPLPSWIDFYDRETARTVRDLFAADFVAYGYPKRLNLFYQSIKRKLKQFRR